MDYTDSREKDLYALCVRLDNCEGHKEAAEALRILISERRSEGFHAPLYKPRTELLDLQKCYIKIAATALEAGTVAASWNASARVADIDALLARVTVLSNYSSRNVDHFYLDGIGNLDKDRPYENGRLNYQSIKRTERGRGTLWETDLRNG